MKVSRRGVGLSLAAAFAAALFVLPYRRACELAPASVAALGLLSCAALQNSVAAAVISLRGRRSKSTERGALQLAIPVAMGLSLAAAGGNTASALAFQVVEPAVVSVLLRSEVLFVGALAALALKEQPSKHLVLGAGVAMLGLLFLVPPEAGVSLGGTVWALVAAFCFATMQVLTRAVASKIDTVFVNALRLWFSVGLLALMPGTLDSLGGMSTRFWQLSFVAALLGPTVSRLLSMRALSYLPAATASLVLLLAPPLVFLLAFAVDGSVPTLREWVGSGLLLLGIMVPLTWTGGLRRGKGEGRAVP